MFIASFCCTSCSVSEYLFPFCPTRWNDLDPKIISLPTVPSFKSALLKFIRPKDISVYCAHDPLPLGVALLRVGFIHLCEHKSRHSFADINDPFRLCRANAIEKIYLLTTIVN